MSNRNVRLYLSDIDDAIDAVRDYTRGMSSEDLNRDRRTKEAVILNFVVIGEAIKNLPSEITGEYPDIPWKEFAGMRDRMVHGYFQISTVILWETIQQDLIPLSSVVKALLR